MRKLWLIPLSLASALAFTGGMHRVVASATQAFHVSGKASGGFQVRTPEGWSDHFGSLGVPLLLTGPEKGGGVPILVVTPMNAQVKAGRLDSAAMKATQDDYRDGRKQYVTAKGGEILGYEEFRSEKWSPDTEANILGVRYRLGDREYAETSYYVTCKGQVVHMKAMLLAEHEKEFANDVRDTVRSLTCAN
jgi:hypothetical protein